MKKILYVLIFISIATILTIRTAFASLPGTGWWSAELIQNVDSKTANIQLTAYDSSSDYEETISDALDPGELGVYQPWNFTEMPSGFSGSAIVSSDALIRALVQISTRITNQGVGDPDTPQYAVATYQGTGSPGNKLNFPLVKNDVNGLSTTFYIQNTGAEAATATATFKLGDASDYTYTTPEIAPGKMVIFSASDARDPGNNPPTSGKFGSLIVTSSVKLAGTVAEHYTSETHATLLLATRGFSEGDSDTKIYAPSIKHSYVGRSSFIYVQNVGSDSISVTVSLRGLQTISGNPSCVGNNYDSPTTSVLAGESVSFDASTILPIDCVASAEIVATGTGEKLIVGQINEFFTSQYLTDNPTIYQQGTSYSTMPSKTATTVISIPLHKEDSNSKQTGVVLQNISDTDATNVVIKFIGKINGVPTIYTSQPRTISAGSPILLYSVRRYDASFWNGPAMTPEALGCVDTESGCGANGLFGILVTSDQPLVSVANESTFPIESPRIIQDKNQYEGFNLNPAP